MDDWLRVLAVDPGDKRIGLAISDLSGTIANPIAVILHVQREKDAAVIISLATQNNVELIVVGQALGDDGEATPSSRKAERLVQSIQDLTDLPVRLWDESGSTNEALDIRIAMGVKRKKRRGHMDDLAATIILQSYLDSSEYKQEKELRRGRTP